MCGEFVFPGIDETSEMPGGVKVTGPGAGLTKRELIAAMALAGYRAGSNPLIMVDGAVIHHRTPELVAKAARVDADALISELSKTKETS